MANIITAGNSTNGGTQIVTDTSGTLNIVTGSGSGANAITIDASQVVTFAGATSVAGNLSFNSGYGSAAVAYGCRAWVNFNGTTNTGGFCTIRASGNVTSVADNGTGAYTVNFTTAMPDANFAYNITGRASAGTAGSQTWAYSITAPTTTTVDCRFQSMGAGGATYTNVDPVDVCVAIFR